MTVAKRAILLFEYDDGTRRAFEFTRISDATLNHGGLPGPARMGVTGQCEAIWDFSGWLTNAATVAIEATGGDTDEHHRPE